MTGPSLTSSHSSGTETEPAPLAPAMAAILRRLPAISGDPRPSSEMTLAEARARTRRVWAGYWNAAPPPVARVEHRIIAGPHGPITVRIYDPDADHDAIVLYFHGGGFVLGDLDTHDGIARRLSLFSGLRFVSVGYRLAPEHPFPMPLDDCVAAIRWATGNLRPSAFGLAGDSAGANLALATALRLRDERSRPADAAFLAFGCYDRTMRAESYRLYGGGDYLLRRTDIDWFWRQYLGDLDAMPPVLAAPIDADLHDLPPLFIGAAECDPLCGDSEAFVARLRAEGRPYTFRLWRGLTHACLGMSRHLDRAERLCAEAATWMRSKLLREPL